MGKITVDLAAMYPQTFGDKDALRRAATAEQLQNAQLNAYMQNQQEKDAIRSNQVLANEDFKVENGVPFKSLNLDQKQEWVRQKQAEWQIQQQAGYTKSKANLAAAEVELEQNLQKKADIKASQQGMMGGIKPGPDWLPGALFGKPYSQQTKDIEGKIAKSEETKNIAGIRLQSLQPQQMPQGFGIPPITTSSQQQPAVQTQPLAQGQAQPQATQSFTSRDEAIKAGSKPGDIVYIQGYGKVRLK